MTEEIDRIAALEKKQKDDAIGYQAAFKDIRLRLNSFHKKLNANYTDGFSLGFKMGSKTDLTIDLREQINKLAKYILLYFPGKIIDEGACLTAIGIMEELRNK